MKVAYQQPVNLGNPGEYTILEVAKLVSELTGADEPPAFHPLPEDDPRKRRPDISLAVRLLDWHPRIGLREGLQRTIEYFRDELKIMDNTTTILEASK
jgi:UDP-glucuronate decarboxylase